MGVLNFNTDNLITGVNIIDGNLYWTDDNSEPKKLEIDRFRDYNHTGVSGTTIRGEEVVESDLTVIRLHPWKAIDVELTPYTPTATQPEAPFEQIFPRFSYRWRYEDGQYTPYAPFTQAAFIPQARRLTSSGTRGDANFMPTTEEENYVEGFNTTMFNNVGTITLNNIPRGPRDVVAVELLYTESISSTIYVLDTIDIPEEQRGNDYVISSDYVSGEPSAANGDYSLLPLSYSLSARKIYSALPANQLSRPYDEVPQRAQSQEITANRLIYGNYQIGFDQPDPLALTTEFISAGEGDGVHVKGNRSYEIGVAYIDAYGRQGSMVQAGTITTDLGEITEQVPLQSDFAQATRQQIQATITSAAPPWADRYRYFIKDVSQDYHSLISYNIYNDGLVEDTGSEYVWVEFQSTDRNKIQDDSVLVSRRVGDTVQTTKQRFLVQDIESAAPAEVRAQIQENVDNVRARNVGFVGGGSYDNAQSASSGARRTSIPAGSTVLYFRDENTGAGGTSLFQSMLRGFNRFIRENQPTEGEEIDLLEIVETDGASAITADLLRATRPLYLQFEDRQGNVVGGDGAAVRVEQVISRHLSGGDPDDFVLEIRLSERVSIDDDTREITDATGNGFPATLATPNEGADPNFRLITTALSEEALERLQGRFWVRTARNGLVAQQSQFNFEGELTQLRPAWFEVEPAIDESQLDLFWESSETFCVCTQHGWPNQLDWYNAIAEVTTGGVYLEATRINDKFNTVQLVKGVRVNVPTERNEVIERPYGLIYSGIYNSRTGINRLNEFITADGIVKELEPNYGAIQKLYTRDTNLLAFTEDKVFRILADKDQLFNADGGGNVSASNAVLGQTTPYGGEYGISRNPESFAQYGHNIYFTDSNRGAVIQLTPANGQMFEISGKGMNDFFRDRLFSSERIYGMFDDYTDKYIVSLHNYNANDSQIDPGDRLPEEQAAIGMQTGRVNSSATLGYELDGETWTSRMSFIPQYGAALNNKFYTWSGGQLWMHNSNTTTRNNFYGTQYNSEVEVIFNDAPSNVFNFLTLNYEGTAGWEIVSITTDQASAQLLGDFITRENKFYQSIIRNIPIYTYDENTNMAVDSGQTKPIQGVKGFYCKVRIRSTATTSAELFAISSEIIPSS